MNTPILQFRGVTKIFQSGLLPWTRRQVRAVDAVSVDLQAGETLGIVGESGSGKSTLLRLALRLERPTSGEGLFLGGNIATLPRRELKAVRRSMQAVFQDPTSSFNPRQTVGRILLAPLEVHGVANASARRQQVGDTLDLVGLNAGFME